MLTSVSKLIFLLLVKLTTAAFDAGTYENHQSLHDDYDLHWTVSGDRIRLALRAETEGWVGFGLAEPGSGGMLGADIVVGSVTEGVGRVTDLYSTANSEPQEDGCQDWILVAASEADGATTLELERWITTGDKQDRPFNVAVGQSTKVIFAWGATDDLAYHSLNRYSTSVYLASEPATGIAGSQEDVLAAIKADPDTQAMPLLLDYTIGRTKDQYHQKCFALSDVAAHIIAIEHQVEASTEPYLHHFVLYGYRGEDCRGEETTLWTWAPGTRPLVLPKEAGLPIGPRWGNSAYKSVMLDVHYSDPSGSAAGMVDTSGIAIYFTPKLRQHDVGVLWLGDGARYEMLNRLVGSGGGLPVGRSKYEFTCPSECTQSWPGPITVFGSHLHMHQTGVQILTEQFDVNMAPVRTTGFVDYYQFNFQDQIRLAETFEVQPGDTLKTTCYFETGGSATQVEWGPGSYDEMCIDFLYFYPDQQRMGHHCDLEGCPAGAVTGAAVERIDHVFGTPDPAVCQPLPTPTHTPTAASPTKPPTESSSDSSEEEESSPTVGQTAAEDVGSSAARSIHAPRGRVLLGSLGIAGLVVRAFGFS